MQDSGLAPLADVALPRAAALSALVGWNQTAADWRLFHAHGQRVSLLTYNSRNMLGDWLRVFNDPTSRR